MGGDLEIVGNEALCQDDAEAWADDITVSRRTTISYNEGTCE